jgi:hypothetical protein
MSYPEFIAKVLKERSVRAAARALQIPQRNMDRYVKSETLPDYATARLFAREAGIGLEEAFEILANEVEMKKSKLLYNTDRADVAQSVEQLIRNQ